MTPQEALAQALLAYTPPLPGPRFPLIEGEADEVAAAILDALPGGRLPMSDDEKEQLRLLCDSYERKGAQQERERLRAEFKVITAYGFTEDARRFVLARLADPEDDR